MPFRPKENLSRLALAIAVPLLPAACSQRTGEAPAPPAVIAEHGVLRIPEHSPLRARLKVQPVLLRDAAHALVEPAVVEADPARTVSILPPLGGRVVELKVGLGDRVSKGQVLALIASGDYAQAGADRAKAHDVFELARKALARAEGVQAAGGNARKDLEAARSAWVQAQAELARADAHLVALGGAAAGPGGRMTVTAPMAGTVTALSTAPGAFVNDVNAPLMTVSNLERVWVTANVAENEVGLVAAGQQAEVTLAAWPGRRFHGTVQFVSAVLDADTRRVKARIALANDDGALKPNMFATAVFQVPQGKALLVPQSALLMNNDRVSVFVEVSPWTFARRTVELGGDEGEQVRIGKGLAPGDRVVVAGGVLIND